MATPIAVPTKNPGEVYIPALGKSFQQVELREDDVHDAVFQASGAITPGTELIYFRDISNKNEQHTSLTRSRNIPSGDECAVFRIGVYPRGAFGNTQPIFADLKKFIENASLTCRFNKRLVTEGPCIKYQSGYGFGGYSDESGATAVTIGVPSAAAAPTLFVPQQLGDTDDLNVKIRLPDFSWITGTNYVQTSLAGGIVVSVFLRAVVKSPLGK